jgi:beta-methylarginine biosynthesis bifunctional aminotransferase
MTASQDSLTLMSGLGDLSPVHRGLSALQRRLAYAAERPARRWINIVENVPRWPASCAGRAAGGRVSAPFSYAPSQGLPELLDEVARWESEASAASVCERNILITAGALHATGLLFRHLAAQGYESVVCVDPVFVGVADLAAAAGLRLMVVRRELLADGSSWPSTGLPERHVLYLNLPSNPTGDVLDEAMAKRLRDHVECSDTFVVFDAVYSSFDFGRVPCPAPVAAAIACDRMAVINSMSKNFGRPGDRIGWILAGETVIARLVPRLEWEVVAVNSAAQLGAVSVLSGGNAALVEAVRAGRETYKRSVAGHEILDVPLPAGGSQLWVDLKAGQAEDFADFAMREFGLLITGPNNYAPVHSGHIRFPTGLPDDVIRAAVDVLDGAPTKWAAR